jgi:hypothetical protein
MPEVNYNTKNETLSRLLQWHLQFPALDITPVFEEQDFNITDFETILILFHATWSGPSIANISKILEKVNTYQSMLKIVMIDIDSVSVQYIESVLGHRSHGHGEALYILNKEIKAKCLQQLDKTEFEIFIDHLKKAD